MEGMVNMKLSLAFAAAVASLCAAASPVNKAASSAPIGVFDSGVGGLTVLEQLLSVDRVDNVSGKLGPDGIPDLQGESFVQLADQANLHYGSYAASGDDGCAFLRELTIRDALFLLSGGYYASASEAIPSGRKTPAKIIVVACNTASAYGLAGVETVLSASASPVKVVGVVNAGARSALDMCGGGAIGVLSTPGTDASRVYPKTIAREAERRGVPAPQVATLGCPDLADAIQRGRADAPAVARGFFRSLVGKFRASGAKKPMSVLVFGCTHYPLMRKAFEEALAEMQADPSFAQLLSREFSFVDPAIETAVECRAILAQEGLLANREGESKVDMFVSVPSSGLPAGFLDSSGGLADEYKYGRKAGRDFTDTKFVPLAAAPAERAAVFGAAKSLPAVNRALSR